MRLLGPMRVTAAVTFDGLSVENLEGTLRQALLEHAPSRPVVPEQCGHEAPPVHEDIDVTVEWVEAQASNDTGQRVVATSHVDGFEAEEDPDRGGRAQQGATRSSRRARVSSRK